MAELLSDHLDLLGKHVHFAASYRANHASDSPVMVTDLMSLCLQVFHALEGEMTGRLGQQPRDWKVVARSMAPHFTQWYRVADRLRSLARELRASGHGIESQALVPLVQAMNVAACYGPDLEDFIVANERVERGERGTRVENVEDELRRRALARGD